MSSKGAGKRSSLKRFNARPSHMTSLKRSKLQVQSAFLRGAKTTQRWNASKMGAARMLANASTAGFLGIEKKFLDTCSTPVAVSLATALTGGVVGPTAGCVSCISCPAQGDTEQSRDGKRLVIDSCIIKGNVEYTETTTRAPRDAVKCFVAIVLDTQANGAVATSQSVFKSLGAVTNLNVCPTKNLLFGNRFRILKSQVYDLTATGVATAGATLANNAIRRDFDWYIPFKGGLPVNLNAGTTADIANVIDNAIYVIAFSTTDEVNIAYNARIRFQG